MLSIYYMNDTILETGDFIEQNKVPALDIKQIHTMSGDDNAYLISKFAFENFPVP